MRVVCQRSLQSRCNPSVVVFNTEITSPSATPRGACIRSSTVCVAPAFPAKSADVITLSSAFTLPQSRTAEAALGIAAQAP
jgi:hypothetical protein